MAEQLQTRALQKIRVFGRRQRFQYAALTGVRLAALVFFALDWFSTGMWRRDPGATLVVAILVLVVLGVDWIRWSALPFMSRPLAVPAEPGLRVAVATTCVADLEPPDFLEPTLRALLALDYPHDTYLLDEGDDPRMKRLCTRLGVFHFSRKNRQEYQAASGHFASHTKHGNYNSWLCETGYGKYDVLIAFDPDHIPERHFTSSMLGYFSDPAVGYVQAPQVYRNQSATWIARGAAEETYQYYSVVQMAAFGTSGPVVTGCHTAHRMSALHDIGGYPEHAAEDLLATVRYRQRGWRGVFVPSVLARGLAPENWADYLNQQFRWAWSVLDIKLNRLNARAGVRHKEPLALLQGFGYIHDALLASIGLPLLCWILATGRAQEPFVRLHGLSGFTVAAATWITNRYKRYFYLEPSREGGLHWRALLLRAGKWPRVLRAFYFAVSNREVEYVVTPKLRGSNRRLALLIPIGASVLCLGAAWTIGLSLQRQLSIVLHLWAAVLIACGITLIASEVLERVP